MAKPFLLFTLHHYYTKTNHLLIHAIRLVKEETLAMKMAYRMYQMVLWFWCNSDVK